MAVTGDLRAHGEFVGFSTGRRILDLIWTITAGKEFDQTVTVTSTPGAFAFLSGVHLIVVKPPEGNAIAWSYSTDGATFLAADLTMPLILTSTGGGAAFYLKTTSGSLAVAVVQF